MSKSVQFPHCDTKILHSPGSCIYCDRHPDWQAYRIGALIAFSDTPQTQREVGGLSPCPSEATRTAEVRDRWGGNRPATAEALAEADAGHARMMAILADHEASPRCFPGREHRWYDTVRERLLGRRSA